nr:protein sieve element occlusion b [Quercus suber]
MACKDPSEEMAYITTKSILEKLKDYPWYAKAVLTLAAFASDYGDFCKHLDKSSSSDQLTKSLGKLKGIQPQIDQKHKDVILELNELIKETFNFIDCIVMLEDRSVKYDRKDVPSLSTAMDSISTYVFWAIITVVACTTRMRLIKDESQTQELSHYAKKIDDTLDKLKLQIQIVEKQAYWKLKRFLQEQHDIVDVLNVLFFARDNRQPVKFFDKETILSIEMVKEKNVLLFFSGLEVSGTSEYVILKTISTHEKMKSKYKIMWIPIVEPWTSVTKQEFDIQRQNMPWYVVQQFSSISGINYVKEQWQFKNEPIIVVLNPQGKVENRNALHMIMAWGEWAIPFTRSKEDELRKRDDWFGSAVLMTEICSSNKKNLLTWFTEKKYIFFYGGDQDETRTKFPAEANKVKIDSVITSAGISIELVPVEKEDSDIFWKIIANYLFFTKSHNDTEIRPDETKKILKLRSYKEKGWVVLCKGTRLVFSGYGPTVLNVMKQFDPWKQQVKTDSEFLEVFEKRYDEELAKNKKNCLDFDMPKNDGLIADGMKCPDCPKTMEMYFRFKCCHG